MSNMLVLVSSIRFEREEWDWVEKETEQPLSSSFKAKSSIF